MSLAIAPAAMDLGSRSVFILFTISYAYMDNQ